MKAAIRFIGLLVLISASTVRADSYMDLITTPPEDGEIVQVETPVSGGTVYRSAEPIGATSAWYDSRIKTRSPVVVSPYPKYTAWLRSQVEEDFSNYTHDQIQNLIYATEAGLLGWGIYELYKH